MQHSVTEQAADEAEGTRTNVIDLRVDLLARAHGLTSSCVSSVLAEYDESALALGMTRDEVLDGLLARMAAERLQAEVP